MISNVPAVWTCLLSCMFRVLACKEYGIPQKALPSCRSRWHAITKRALKSGMLAGVLPCSLCVHTRSAETPSYFFSGFKTHWNGQKLQNRNRNFKTETETSTETETEIKKHIGMARNFKTGTETSTETETETETETSKHFGTARNARSSANAPRSPDILPSRTHPQEAIKAFVPVTDFSHVPERMYGARYGSESKSTAVGNYRDEARCARAGAVVSAKYQQLSGSWAPPGRSCAPPGRSCAPPGRSWAPPGRSCAPPGPDAAHALYTWAPRQLRFSVRQLPAAIAMLGSAAASLRLCGSSAVWPCGSSAWALRQLTLQSSLTSSPQRRTIANVTRPWRGVCAMYMGAAAASKERLPKHPQAPASRHALI
eukprot:95678-Chlamydomonas_euryale.AAC.1